LRGRGRGSLVGSSSCHLEIVVALLGAVSADDLTTLGKANHEIALPGHDLALVLAGTLCDLVPYRRVSPRPVRSAHLGSLIGPEHFERGREYIPSIL